MFTSKVILEKELKEKERFHRKKIFEDERKKRVFNTKQRMIGVDKKELDKQLQEKKLKKDFEKALEDKYYRHQVFAIAEADKLEKEIVETKRRINQEINLFRKVYQRKSNDPEEELNRNGYQKQPGVSSGLMFDGEDVEAKNRKLIQTQQQKYWLLQQIAEKNQSTKEKSFAEKIHGDSLRARETRAIALEILEKECRRQTQIATKEYNEALMRQQTFKKNLNSKKEREDNEIEIMNSITSDLLTENTEVAQSSLGSARVIQYNYKGMSLKEQLDIRKAQMEQIKERQIIVNEEINCNQKWSDFYKQMDNLLLKNEELRKNVERKNYKSLMEKNKLLSLNMKVQNLQKKKEETCNYSTPEFLHQFNKTSR